MGLNLQMEHISRLLCLKSPAYVQLWDQDLCAKSYEAGCPELPVGVEAAHHILRIFRLRASKLFKQISNINLVKGLTEANESSHMSIN